MKRHGLLATGHGKKRRLPRATVEALALRLDRGCGPQTVNHYVRAVRGFFRWMVKSKRCASDPLDTLSLVNVNVDVRHARRELTAAELGRLLVAAESSVKSFRGLTGVDRFHLYLAAATTGFRAYGLANLTPEDFDPDATTPTVTLKAKFAKNGRLKAQPLPEDAAAALRDYLEGKPAGRPVWGGTWADDGRGAEMMRVDLKAAGIPYVVEGPGGPEHADFHALRHSYLTLLGKGGVDLRTVQEMAGHSKPELTARYMHTRIGDMAGAAAKLPTILPSGLSDPLRVAHRVVDAGRAGMPADARNCTTPGGAGRGPETTQAPANAGACVGMHVVAPSEDDGTRTRNHRIDSPELSIHNPLISQALTSLGRVGLHQGCTDSPAVAADLGKVIEAWHRLPDHVRRTIVTLAESVR